MQHITSNRRHKFMTFLPHTSWSTAQVTLLTLGTNIKSETNYITDGTFLYPSAISVGATWHLRGPGDVWQGENTSCIFICALERAASQAEGQRSYSYCGRHLLKPLHVFWMSNMMAAAEWAVDDPCTREESGRRQATNLQHKVREDWRPAHVAAGHAIAGKVPSTVVTDGYSTGLQDFTVWISKCAQICCLRNSWTSC